ncbi:hypothetical protein [Bacillus cereus group sp. BfR-BA-01380]|uniref:hypothetical protein n=1 Tax=Bacillus cereus group sp. BfR-BA-01380 TaxID=2920324 RepID=UPI001F599539|nr:hypothetical protein [Bacillus cereus group sp. BfR-BA-01380]
MKKIGTVLLVSIISVGFVAMAEGDTPAPQKPNLAYNIGDTGGIISNKSVKDPGTGSPAYSHGNTGGSPADNKGDTPTPQRPDLAYTHGETWSPAYNIGDGGIISNEAVKDPGGGMVSNDAEGDLLTMRMEILTL